MQKLIIEARINEYDMHGPNPNVPWKRRDRSRLRRLPRGRGCPVTSVPAADVERAVLDHVQKLLAAPELAARTWATAKRESEDDIGEREVTILLAEFATVWGELFPAEQARIVEPSVITIWLIGRARNPELPRRLVYVLDRRVVVDQVTAVAGELIPALRAC